MEQNENQNQQNGQNQAPQQGQYQAPQGQYQAPQGQYQAPQGQYYYPPQGAPMGYANPYDPAMPPASKSKIAAGLFGILLGSLGIHKFYLGYAKEGLIMLLVSLLTFGIGAIVMEIIGLIEGILYLTKGDDEFYWTYVANHKGWF